jgi:hypothetical protein
MAFRMRGGGTTCAIFWACSSWIAIGCGSEPDSNICNCMPGAPLDCFFDTDGGRPASDVGLADQLCVQSFPVRPCVDNVEVFHYGNCNRTEVRVTGCFADTQFFFDAATHTFLGASYGSDTDVQCPATGERVWKIRAGEALPASCVMSSCSLECRIIGGNQFPTCIVPDAADADAAIDASDGAPL